MQTDGKGMPIFIKHRRAITAAEQRRRAIQSASARIATTPQAKQIKENYVAQLKAYTKITATKLVGGVEADHFVGPAWDALKLSQSEVQQLWGVSSIQQGQKPIHASVPPTWVDPEDPYSG